MNTISIIYMVTMSIMAIMLFRRVIVQNAIITYYKESKNDDRNWIKGVSIHTLLIIRGEYVKREDYENADKCSKVIDKWLEETELNKGE